MENENEKESKKKTGKLPSADVIIIRTITTAVAVAALLIH